MKIKLFLSLLSLLLCGYISSISAEKSLPEEHIDELSYQITDNSDLSINSVAPNRTVTRARNLTHEEITTACGHGKYPPTPDYIFNAIIVNASGLEAQITVHYELKGARPQIAQRRLTIPTGGVWVLPFAGKRSLGTGNHLYSIHAIVGGYQVNFLPRQPIPGGLFIIKRADIGSGFCFAGPVYDESLDYTADFVNATGTGLQLDIYNGGGSCESIKSNARDFPNGAYAQLNTKQKCDKGCAITRVSNRTNGSPGVIIYGPGQPVCNGVFVFNNNNVSTGRDRYLLYPAMSFPAQ